MGCRVCCFVLITTLGGPAAAVAQSTTPAATGLEELRTHVLHARYDEAVDAADTLLQRDDLTARERNLGLELEATALIARRDAQAAQQTLQRLYRRDPGHHLTDPNASPPVQAAFARARESATEPLQPELDHTPPTLSDRRTPVVEARVGDHADVVAELRLHYKRADSDAFSGVVMDEGQPFRARIPLSDDETRYTVRYFIEARAPSGAVLATAGRAEDPLHFVVPAADVQAIPVDTHERPAGDDDGGILSAWWLWTAVGIVVAGGAAAGAYFLTSDGGSVQSGSLGTVSLD